MALSSEQEVRVAAINAAVFHHKRLVWNQNNSQRNQPPLPLVADVLATARIFEQRIQGED